MESGFNPDAAAGTTSAHGIGQFINKTGAAYHLNDCNRWSIFMQTQALAQHTAENIASAKSNGLDIWFAYARHHDGSFKNKYKGMDLAKGKFKEIFLRIVTRLSHD